MDGWPCSAAAEFAAAHPSPSPGSPEAETLADLQKRAGLYEAVASGLGDVDAGPIWDVVAWCEGEASAAAAAPAAAGASSSSSSHTSSAAAAPSTSSGSSSGGGVWRVAVDTLGTGDLSSALGLTNFALERQWATVDDDTLLNYAVNVSSSSRPRGTSGGHDHHQYAC